MLWIALFSLFLVYRRDLKQMVSSSQCCQTDVATIACACHPRVVHLVRVHCSVHGPRKLIKKRWCSGAVCASWLQTASVPEQGCRSERKLCAGACCRHMERNMDWAGTWCQLFKQFFLMLACAGAQPIAFDISFLAFSGVRPRPEADGLFQPVLPN